MYRRICQEDVPRKETGGAVHGANTGRKMHDFSSRAADLTTGRSFCESLRVRESGAQQAIAEEGRTNEPGWAGQGSEKAGAQIQSEKHTNIQ